jgi:tRNA (guanine37-N1)-methyltransferase|tara:strand:+ start:7007 stop:8017 length:1011 start_codon:yes stop_codon:yes gene_type:complete
MSNGLKVPVKDAENVKKHLQSLGVFDSGKKVKRRRDYVIFPIKYPVEMIYKVVEEEFIDDHRFKFQDYLKEFLSQSQIDIFGHSYDVIGNIAIIRVPSVLASYENKIADSLLKAHRNIKKVYKKAGSVKGKSRTRELVHLGGGKGTITQHNEYGCRYMLDVSKVYFSPRLAYERNRILEIVRDGEVIIDFFSGVGPFSIILAKNRDVQIYSMDANPLAYKYLKKNIILNNVVNKVIPVFGNCLDVAPKGIANRVIMNLPKSSDEYLSLAFDVIKKGVIHFYSISYKDDLYDSKIIFIKNIAKNKKRKINILNKRVVRSYSPNNYLIAIDIFVDDSH